MSNQITSDIILDYPSNYFDNNYDYDKILEYLFCVDDLANTRILSSNMRPLRVTKNIRQKFKISDNFNEKELNNKLSNIKVGIIRRKEINGIKIDGEYFIDFGTLQSIENINCFQISIIYILTKNGLEKIRPNRVYLLK